MKVIVAGATGTLGRPLVAALLSAGHEVVGIARTPQGADILGERGATAILADATDREALLRAGEGLQADAVINELTALKKAPATFGAMRETNRLRIEGTHALLELAKSAGATRFITQSIVFGYGYTDHGDRVLTEHEAFGVLPGDSTAEPIAAMVSTEEQAFSAEGIDGIALRYGLFYGEDVTQMHGMLRRRSLPVPATWRGAVPLISHDDAAAATVAALERGMPGRAYNIADDTPVSWSEFVRTVASATGAPAPLALPDGLLRAVAPYAGVMMTRVNLRVSSQLAKDELGWAPRYPSVAEGARAAAQRAGLEPPTARASTSRQSAAR